MVRAILLIFEPVAAWNRILRAERRTAFILLAHLLPLLLLTSFCEGYGLVHWGKPRGVLREITQPKYFTHGEAVLFEAGQLLLSLAVVFVGAGMLRSVAETFCARNTYTDAFSVVAYGLSPLFLLRIADAAPQLSPWVSWTVGILLSIGALYHGVPRMMEPDPSHAFGLFVISSVVLVLISGMVRFVTWWYLAGRFTGLESAISDLAPRLHL